MKLFKYIILFLFLINSYNISSAKDPSALINEIVDEAANILSSDDPVESKIIKLNAIALDGVVEGIEHDLHKWCVGVQWHPEFLNTKYDKMIIKDFIGHCG